MAESFHLLRDPGFNVAYWNLHARPVSERDGTWWVAGDAPLRLFHFSGYDYRRPETLSKHQDRIDLAELPDLRRLCDGYAAELRAEGVEQVSRFPYSLATTASGIRLDGRMRRIYRELVLDGFRARRSIPPARRRSWPSSTPRRARAAAFGITRYLEDIYEHRPDLQRAYPDLDAQTAPGFLGLGAAFGPRTRCRSRTCCCRPPRRVRPRPSRPRSRTAARPSWASTSPATSRRRWAWARSRAA